jgi:hypothetical protein
MGQSLYLREKSLYWNNDYTGQSLYGDKVYTGQSS